MKKALLFILLIFFQGTMVFGQTSPGVDFYFEIDTLSAEHGKTFTTLLVVKNSSGKEVTIEQIMPESAYPGLLLFPTKSLVLTPNEKKTYPIKFIANTDFMKMKSPEISFNLTYSISGENNTRKASFWIKKEDEKQIALHSLARESYIHPLQKETKVSFFVENRSYSNRSIKLKFNTQLDDLEISPKQQIITLEAQEKKWIEVNVALKRKSDIFPDYNLQVEAIDLVTNEKGGSTYIKIIVLSNNRQIIRNTSPQIGKNFVELAYNGNSSNNNYAQLRGNTEFSAGKNREGRFNLNGDYFLSGDRYKLYDTWFEFESKNNILRLGNVYANEYDYSVSGRGVKTNISLGNNGGIEVFALENNYDLYGSYYAEGESSRIAGAKYQFGTRKKFNGKVSYLFDSNPRLKTDSHLAHWASTFNLDALQTLQMDGGLSYEKGKINHDENIGASATANYIGQFSKWELNSMNTYATKSYVGLNRGSFNLNQYIAYKLTKKQRLFLRYQNAQVEPEYLSSQTLPDSLFGGNYFPKYFYSTQSAQLGYQIAWSNLNIMLAPQVEKQKNINSLMQSELLSYRILTNISSAFGVHGIHLSAEYSYSKASQQQEWFHSFRSTLSYRFHNFGINGSVQANPVDVIELNQYNYGNEDFVNYTVYASYNFQTSNRDFSGSVTAGTNFSGLYKNQNQNVSANLEYRFTDSWASTAYGNYSNYRATQINGYAGDNYQVRLGVKKYFIKATTAGNHKVKLQLFEDTNANGTLDPGEKVIANQVVKLNDFIAVTDESGRVTFQNVPKGSYTLKINQTAELMLMMDSEILVSQNLKLPIGLIKNKKVTGKLVEIKQAYDVLGTDVRGVVVYARDQNGAVQSTVVNQNDEFEFFLKDGEYDIFIENDKYTYTEASKRITVSNAIDSELLLFEYSKKNITIKVKKF